MENIPGSFIVFRFILQTAMEFGMRCTRLSTRRRDRPRTGGVIAALKGRTFPLGRREMRCRHPLLPGGQRGRPEFNRFLRAGCFVFKRHGGMTLRAQQPRSRGQPALGFHAGATGAALQHHPVLGGGRKGHLAEGEFPGIDCQRR